MNDGALAATEARPHLTELSTANLARIEMLILARVYTYFTASTTDSVLTQQYVAWTSTVCHFRQRLTASQTRSTW